MALIDAMRPGLSKTAKCVMPPAEIGKVSNALSSKVRCPTYLPASQRRDVHEHLSRPSRHPLFLSFSLPPPQSMPAPAAAAGTLVATHFVYSMALKRKRAFRAFGWEDRRVDGARGAREVGRGGEAAA
eukprot:3662597-Pleurochrysis_carterae.AAC.1